MAARTYRHCRSIRRTKRRRTQRGGGGAEDRRGLELINSCLLSQISTAIAIIGAGGVNLNFKDEDGDTPLIAASREGLITVVDALLAKRVDVNAASADGWTALMWACMRNHEDIALVLLAVPGINVNAVSNERLTVLNLCDAMSVVVKDRLLALGATKDGRTPAALGRQLNDVCTNKNAAAALAIIATGRVDLTIRDSTERTSLMIASAEGLTDVVVALLATGVMDVNAVDSGGNTALIWACYSAHTDTVDVLLKVPGIDINAINYKRHTALRYWGTKVQNTRNRQLDITRRMLALGAKVSVFESS